MTHRPQPGRARRSARGNSTIEFTLVGIPLICIMILTFEVARGMWYYHTLASAVKEGVRFSVVHGQNCAAPPNTCTVTVSGIANVIRRTAVGLAPESMRLTFVDANNSTVSCLVNDCIANHTGYQWPPASANAPGQNVRISGTYPFRSALLFFWPGAGRPLRSRDVISLSSASRESIQF